MSTIKKNPLLDSEEDDDLATYMHSKSLMQRSQQLKSPSSKKDWKYSNNAKSLQGSQFLSPKASKKKVWKPEYPLPSQSCAREKQELRHQLGHLEQAIKNKNDRIKQLKGMINTEKQNKQDLSEQLTTQKEWKYIAESLKDENFQLKQAELKLHNELQDQQILCRDSLTKLYEFREQALEEKERLRTLYEQYIEDKVQEERAANMHQINNLLDINDKMKAQMIDLQTEIHSLKNQEKLMNQVYNYKSAILKKQQLQDYEDQRLQLLSKQKINQQYYDNQIDNLRTQLQIKDKELVQKDIKYHSKKRHLKSQLDLDQSRRIEAELENNDLKRELYLKDDQLRNSDLKYKIKKQELDQSVGRFQNEISHLKYDLEDVKYENRRILNSISPPRRGRGYY